MQGLVATNPKQMSTSSWAIYQMTQKMDGWMDGYVLEILNVISSLNKNSDT